jgi:predicted nucleotide-binding protein (sugar kinase/HSP70/actin superfamily)
MGNYGIAAATLAEALDCEVLMPPATTRRTLELGERNSPEFVCVPFKYNLGTFIEALELGANLIGQAGGGCRFAYYGEVAEAILSDMGYEFEMVRLTGAITPVSVYWDFKRHNPRLTVGRLVRQYRLAQRQVHAIDRVEEVVRRNSGFETKAGAHDAVFGEFVTALRTSRDTRSVVAAESEALAALRAIEVERPERPLRVGVVGELYVLMEPYSNYFIERELARAGIEVHRFVTLSGILGHNSRRGYGRYIEEMLSFAGPYLEYHVGADGTESVARAHTLMREGFDGVIHLKPFGCMPEVNAMAALQRMSRENTFPILFMSFDAQTSETGIRTRLEAFTDMLKMRREWNADASPLDGNRALA